jgi:hypothetical protein
VLENGGGGDGYGRILQIQDGPPGSSEFTIGRTSATGLQLFGPAIEHDIAVGPLPKDWIPGLQISPAQRRGWICVSNLLDGALEEGNYCPE